MKKSLIFLLTFAVLLSFTGVAYAVELANPLGNTTFIGLICKIVAEISKWIGALAVLMFVWGGILFVTSAGNEGRIGTAKKIIIYAAIGTGIALAGFGLIELVATIIGAEGVRGCPVGP